MYAQSSGATVLFTRAVAAWKNHATAPQGSAPVLDIQTMRVGILSVADIGSLTSNGKAAGAFNATDVANQIFGFQDMGVAADGCEQTASAVGAVGGAIVGGFAGFFGGGIAGGAVGTVTLPIV